MTFDALKPNVQYLQTDVIELLGQISSLMHRASIPLISDSASEKYGQFQQEITNAGSNVEKLKLMMAIVAPMKAGKSTIVNAIVGQEILPSRNAAMTTLPTEIIFDAALEEPKLTLSQEILSVFRETFLALKGKIQALGIEQMQEKIAQYPHLVNLLQEIQDNVKFPISATTSGREEIMQALTSLNDLIRLCSLLEPSKDPLSQLTDIPCIQTPFWRSPKNDQPQMLGNLVIVDTPGPNEAGENLNLASVVAEQLQKSSIVLIILDFTQLKTEAAEKVKKDVQQVINLRGKENLYVLINKVDQRRENDITPEQVQQFVAAELELGDEETNRVFEVSARRAFSAANFMQELEQHPDVALTEMQTARSLAQEVFGIDWEEELEEATVEELQKKAQRLWKKSGFEPFLLQAINTLMERAAPRCMSSALNVCRNHLVELQDNVKLRSSAIAQDAEKLQREFGALEGDLHRLELCHSRIKEVDAIKAQLHQNLNYILHALKNAARVSLETYFVQEKSKLNVANATISSKLKNIDIEARPFLARKFFFNQIGDFEIFPNWISKRINSVVEVKSSGVFESISELEAEEFANQAVAYAKQRADSLLESVREKIGKEIERARTDLIKFLEQQTKPIVERARTRLNEAFNVNLSLPQPRLEAENMNIIEPHVKLEERYIEQGYEEIVKKKREWRRWLWLISVEVTEQVKRPDKKEEVYTVSLEELVFQINQSLEANINIINQEINNYLDKDFQERVDIFFKDLDSYLWNYRDSLRQAQADQQLSLDQKEKLVGELGALVVEAAAKIRKTDIYLEYTDHLMADK